MGAAANLIAGFGWTSAPPPDGIDELYVDIHDRAAAGLSRLPREVVVDVAIAAMGTDDEGGAQHAGRGILGAIRARPAGGPHDEPLALQGAIVRARYVPAAFAEAGFLMGVGTTVRALSGSGIEEAQRGQLAAAGLGEAGQAFALAGDARGAFFDRIEMWIDGGYGSIAGGMTASPGPAGALQEAAWAKAAAIALPGTFASLDVSVAWLKSWTMIGKDPMDPRDFEHALRDAGWAGNLVALPQLLAAGSWEPMNRFSRKSGWARRLERMAVFSPAEHAGDGHVGLFPAGTKPADLECALVEPPEPCAGDKKLRRGAVAEHDGRSFKLIQIKGRWAIVVGRDKKTVEGYQPELIASSAPVRFELPGGALLAKELKPLPPGLFGERYVVEASIEGGRAALRAHPVAGSRGSPPAGSPPAHGRTP
jgi:hypothetical protein